MRKVINEIFLIALFLPLLAVVLSPHFASSMKQVAIDRSAWTAKKDLLRRTTPLWNEAVVLYNTLLYRSGSSGNKNVAIVGRDGWVFLGDMFDRNFSQATSRRVMSDAEVVEWHAAISGQQAAASAYGSAYLFVVAPAKWSVYRDKLPKWADALQANTSQDVLLAGRREMPVLDLRGALRSARSHGETYSKLNTHWSDYGAWVAWAQISTRLMELRPDLDLPEFKVSTLNSTDKGNEFLDLIGIEARNPVVGVSLSEVPAPYYIVNPDGTKISVPWNTTTSLLDMPRMTLNPGAKSDKKALVLRDSMGDALSPFLQSAFREVIQVGHSLEAPLKRPDLILLLEQHKPDVVLFVTTERYLNAAPYLPGYWRLAKAYYNSAARQLVSWHQSQSGGGITVSGNASSYSPLKVVLGDIALATTHSAILKMDIDSSESVERVDFELSCAGRSPLISTYSIKKGSGRLFFEVRAPCEGELKLVARQSLASIRINAIEIRQL